MSCAVAFKAKKNVERSKSITAWDGLWTSIMFLDNYWLYEYVFLILPHVEGVVNVSLDQLHRNEVITFASIVQYQTILIRGLDLEVHVHHVVRLHGGQAQVGVVGGEGDWLVDAVLHVLELYIS